MTDTRFHSVQLPYFCTMSQRLILFVPILSFLLLGPFRPDGFCQGAVFHEEPSVQQLIEANTQRNLNPARKIEVWRIQIGATVDRRNMETTKAEFNRKYSWLTLVSSYSEPYYKLMVGAYQNKRNAEVAILQLKRDYPSAYLVRDKVRLQEISD